MIITYLLFKEQVKRSSSFVLFFNLFIDLREREPSVCCSTYLCMHWLLLICALIRDGTCSLGVSG